jgi:ribulose-phosphate 3-epimerase
MSVNPGWGGQSFIASSPAKVERLKPLVGDAAIEVDGGIEVANAAAVVAAGASILVAGSSIFGTPDPAAATRALRDAAGAQARRS